MKLNFTLVDDVTHSLSRLPGIGEKTAFKYALWLIKEKNEAKKIVSSIDKLINNIQLCKKCRNITKNEDGLCDICKENFRDKSSICIVENIENLLAIESSSVYNGTYFTLWGLISPLYGVNTEQLGLNILFERVREEHTKEVIMVISSNMEGDLTAQYIKEKLSPLNVDVTRIAYGVPLGADINYVDKDTLLEAFKGRHTI